MDYDKTNYETCNLVNFNSNLTTDSSRIEGELVDELKHDLKFEIEELPEAKLFRDLRENFKQTKTEFLLANKKYKQEYKKTKQDVELIQSHSNYIEKLTEKYKAKEQTEIDNTMKDVKEQLQSISKKLVDHNRLTEYRQNYETQRKKMLQYLHIIQIVNNFNVGTTCSLCMYNNVDSYFDPCGHTMCKDCIEKMNIHLYDNNSNCPFCKNIVKMIKPLYFI